MPANYARFLIGRNRSLSANRHLGLVLSFVAGAIHAGGFLAVKQYTSHVTGMVSSLADNTVLGQGDLITTAAVGVLGGLLGCFLGGGMVGALGFKYIGYASTIPLALLLAAMAVVPAVDDWQQRNGQG